MRLTLFFSHIVAFAPFAPLSSTNPQALSTLGIQKVVYMLCSMLAFVVGIWKCNQMGLLPIGTGDWLAFETRRPVSLSTFPSTNTPSLLHYFYGIYVLEKRETDSQPLFTESRCFTILELDMFTIPSQRLLLIICYSWVFPPRIYVW